MRQKVIYFAAIIVLNAHSFFTMPPWRDDTWDRLARMSLRSLDGLEPYTFTLFVLFGMFSLLLAALILVDGRYQRFAAWPFALSIVVLGPSMIFLYQAFRRTGLSPQRPPNRLERLAQSRILPLAIAVFALGALWDSRGGDLDNLWHLFQTDYITHAMLVDEALFIILTPILVAQDCRRHRRGISWAWIALFLPVFGACAYLATSRNVADRFQPDRP